jgi:cold shock CspA family protein
MYNKRKMGKEIGNVLWFDQKKGFGFVKVITPDSDLSGNEVFVHYSQIQCESSYKKLYPGENVSLNVDENEGSDDPKKKYVSSEITGLFGSKLLVDNEEYIIKVIRKRENRKLSDGDDGGDDVN